MNNSSKKLKVCGVMAWIILGNIVMTIIGIATVYFTLAGVGCITLGILEWQECSLSVWICAPFVGAMTLVTLAPTILILFLMARCVAEYCVEAQERAERIVASSRPEPQEMGSPLVINSVSERSGE